MKDIWDLFFDGNETIAPESEIENSQDSTLSDQIQSIGYDLDGDGEIDRIILGADFDGDGSIDRILGEINVDEGGVSNELFLDTYNGTDINQNSKIFSDETGDAITSYDDLAGVDMETSVGENMIMMHGDGDKPIFEAVNGFFDNGEIPDALEDESFLRCDTYDTFDPDKIENGNIIGDPEEYIDNWHIQETDYSCAVAAQEFVIEELLDVSIDESDLREIAFENGWLSEAGTVYSDIGKLMEHMGISVERSFNNTLEDLCKCLEKGHQSIVFLDSDELWSGKNEELFCPGMDANHAIQVIGVDVSDPNDPMIILNDSGVANGAGAMVSADLFMGAWEDSGCYMVEAYV